MYANEGARAKRKLVLGIPLQKLHLFWLLRGVVFIYVRMCIYRYNLKKNCTSLLC